MISVKKASELLNRSAMQIGRYCESGELIAQRVGKRVWVIEENSVHMKRAQCLITDHKPKFLDAVMKCRRDLKGKNHIDMDFIRNNYVNHLDFLKDDSVQATTVDEATKIFYEHVTRA